MMQRKRTLITKFVVRLLHFESNLHVLFHRFWYTLGRGNRHEKKERNFLNLRLLRGDSFVASAGIEG